MTVLLDKEIELYPELLRRLAAGERLASASDEAEKLGATMLAAEAIENEKAKDAPAQEKTAIVELGIGAVLGAALKEPVKSLIRKLRGEPVVPETAEELMKSFRKILEEREKTEAARRAAIVTGLLGAGAGALAVKALSKKEESKAAASVQEVKISNSTARNTVVDASTATPEEKKADEPPADKIEKVEEGAPSGDGNPGARALLERLLKKLQ
jgi:hypothetical protein